MKKRFCDQTTSELDARLQEAASVRQMIDLLEGFDDTPEYRAKILEWTRTAEFPGNTAAACALYSLQLINSRGNDGEFVLRATDVAGYVSWLKQGIPRHCQTLLAVIAIPISQLCAHFGMRGLRYWEEGLGWFQSLEFASPISGRRYSLFGTLWTPLQGPAFTDAYSEDGDPADLISELFECLAIDDADTSYLEARIPQRWRLLRQDDNGHPFEIARLSGRSKALKTLAEYERRAHKQTYWLEAIDAGN